MPSTPAMSLRSVTSDGPPQAVLPEAFLNALPVGGGVVVALCSQHRSCYTQDTLDRHLVKAHRTQKARRREILQDLRDAGLATNREAVPLLHNVVPFPGLPILQGYRCSQPACSYISTSMDTIDHHSRATHRWSSGQKGRKKKEAALQQLANPYTEVAVQTFWAKTEHQRYFIVKPEGEETEPSNDSPVLARHPEGEDNVWANLQARYQQAQVPLEGSQLDQAEHISEATPWLRETGYHSHLQGLPIQDIPSSYRLPATASEDEAELATLCASIGRVLSKGMAILRNNQGQEERQLSRLNAKLLNTFRGAEMSQDPIKPLQNARSKDRYIACWKQLVCYFVRVTQQGCLMVEGKPPFRPTPEQQHCLATAWTQAEQLCQEEEGEEGEGEGEEGERDRLQAELDRAVLAFSLSLIQHRLDRRAFDSAIVSFAAVLAWDSKRKTWMEVGNYTSYLSQIIYDCQILVLLHCLDRVDAGQAKDLTVCLTAVRDKWLLNDTPGPVAELSGTRLLGFAIGKSTVQQAQVRWHADAKTIVYREVQLCLDQLPDLITHQLQAAQVLFRQNLCFGLEEIPSYALSELVDNWDACSPGQSFLTDHRNEGCLDSGQSWLIDHLRLKPETVRLLFCSQSQKATSQSPWQLDSTAVTFYEDAVQRFLEHMLVLMHIASGQPARRPELLGLRWCNRQADKRNLFIHDGYVLFILTYHKSLNLQNSSRFPVRFLLPEVGQLLVQYLVLVQPFRKWLSAEAGNPQQVSEYLWHNGAAVWPEDKITQALQLHTVEAIGVKLSIQAWRQLAVGIAIKKFSGQGYRLDLDLPADGHAGLEEESATEASFAGSMPEAFHWQASHNPRTGNAVYGGTVNFNQGLTDAGLQEYLHASQLWHSLYRKPGQKHGRQESLEGGWDQPLVKRLAFRKGPWDCRRVWTSEEALAVLKHMYGPGATYKGKQGEAIQAIINNRLQVVAVLSTGEGKSLLYQLPARLPGAGTTVLIVPLVALKQDTVRKCHQLGIQCAVWSLDQPPGFGCPLVIVSLDQAVQGSFRTFANQLDAAGSLARVVIDECHLVCTAESYRRQMIKVKQLRTLRCQFVLLTATLPPAMESAFEAALLLQRPLYIRSSTMRTDLEYRSVHIPSTSSIRSSSFELAAAVLIQEHLRADWFTREGAQARALVFVRMKLQADAIAQKLGCPKYYSDSGTEEEKAAVLTQWASGVFTVLVATSALAGVDYQHVRAVFHIGEPSGGAIDFAQDVGRAGRDGGGGMSIVFLSPRWQAQYNTEGGAILPENVRAIQRFLDAPRCRMVPLGLYLDGQAQSCSFQATACDRCRQLGLLPTADKAGNTDNLDQSQPSPGQDRRRDGNVGLGNALVQRHNSQTAHRLRDFVDGLNLFCNSCIICRFVGNVRPSEAEHLLDKCRSIHKWPFLNAKKTAIREGQRLRGGWFPRYGACYRCGNIQAVCAQQGHGECRYRDLIMPLCWSVLHRADWREVVLEGLPQGLVASQEEGRYMLWLGEEAVVYGEQGTNLTLVAERVMRMIVASDGLELGPAEG